MGGVMARYGSRRWLKKQAGRAREEARAEYHRTQGRSWRIWLQVPSWRQAQHRALDDMMFAFGKAVGIFMFRNPGQPIGEK